MGAAPQHGEVAALSHVATPGISESHLVVAMGRLVVPPDRPVEAGTANPTSILLIDLDLLSCMTQDQGGPFACVR
jgi:hypothetical protein